MWIVSCCDFNLRAENRARGRTVHEVARTSNLTADCDTSLTAPQSQTPPPITLPQSIRASRKPHNSVLAIHSWWLPTHHLARLIIQHLWLTPSNPHYRIHLNFPIGGNAPIYRQGIVLWWICCIDGRGAGCMFRACLEWRWENKQPVSVPHWLELAEGSRAYLGQLHRRSETCINVLLQLPPPSFGHFLQFISTCPLHLSPPWPLKQKPLG